MIGSGPVLLQVRGNALRRFFVEEIAVEDGTCVISGSEARHITRVLRMGRGNRLILMDGKGARFQVLIESVGHQEVKVVLENPMPKPPRSPVRITICQAVLKSRAMDFLVQKISELGVDDFSPFSSKRTVVRLDRNRAKNKNQHWREIAQSATKQADRRHPMKIDPLSSFGDLMKGIEKDVPLRKGGALLGKGVPLLRKRGALKVILWEEESKRNLKHLLGACSPGRRFIGVVGPEGGFDKEEIRAAEKAGFIPTSLGNRVMRAETAAITLAAIVQYEWGDLSLKAQDY